MELFDRLFSEGCCDVTVSSGLDKNNSQGLNISDIIVALNMIVKVGIDGQTGK